MIILGRKVYLRAIREKDIEWIIDHASDIEQRGLYFPLSIFTETSLRQEVHDNGFWGADSGSLLICAPSDDAILGALYCLKGTPYWDSLEVGYRLYDLRVSGQGIMTEALALFTYVLFITKKINRLELKIFPENIASKRVAQKCGYQFEGIARGVMLHRGAFRDMEIYSLLRDEAPQTVEEALNRIAT